MMIIDIRVTFMLCSTSFELCEHPLVTLPSFRGKQFELYAHFIVYTYAGLNWKIIYHARKFKYTYDDLQDVNLSHESQPTMIENIILYSCCKRKSFLNVLFLNKTFFLLEIPFFDLIRMKKIVFWMCIYIFK